VASEAVLGRRVEKCASAGGWALIGFILAQNSGGKRGLVLIDRNGQELAMTIKPGVSKLWAEGRDWLGDGSRGICFKAGQVCGRCPEFVRRVRLSQYTAADNKGDGDERPTWYWPLACR
jgi:hypothetical protein